MTNQSVLYRQMQSNIGAAQARVQIRSNPPPYPVPPPPYPGPVSNIQVSFCLENNRIENSRCL